MMSPGVRMYGCRLSYTWDWSYGTRDRTNVSDQGTKTHHRATQKRSSEDSVAIPTNLNDGPNSIASQQACRPGEDLRVADDSALFVRQSVP